MGSPRPTRPNSARTARTYPVGPAELARAVEDAVRGMERWTLARSSPDEIRAVRRTRLGFGDDVVVRLVPPGSGARTNTHAGFESASRVGGWDLGQNRRNLRELLAATDAKLAGRGPSAP